MSSAPVTVGQTSDQDLETSSQPRVLTDADSATLSGILVGKSSGNNSPMEIGTIDPATGVYARFAEFPAEANPLADGRGLNLSPDLSRIAAVKTIAQNDTVGGWYTTDGMFHQATADMAKKDFDTGKAVVDAYFDFQGRFWYTTQSLPGGVDREAYVADKGDTSGGKFYGTMPYNGPTILPSGAVAAPSTCAEDKEKTLMSPNIWVVAGSQQVNVGSYSNNGSCTDSFKSLLPATNTGGVDPRGRAVTTRDKSRVAFFYSSGGGPDKLYTVDMSGGAAPVQVPGVDQDDLFLFQWRS